jgi:hypothetical protein
MKFFRPLKSNRDLAYLAYLYGAQDTPELAHRLCFPYSKLHNRLPKSVDPNIAFSTLDTPAATNVMFDLSASSQVHLYSMRGDTQYACEHVLYSLLLLVSEHSRYFAITYLYQQITTTFLYVPL